MAFRIETKTHVADGDGNVIAGEGITKDFNVLTEIGGNENAETQKAGSFDYLVNKLYGRYELIETDRSLRHTTPFKILWANPNQTVRLSYIIWLD